MKQQTRIRMKLTLLLTSVMFLLTGCSEPDTKPLLLITHEEAAQADQDMLVLNSPEQATQYDSRAVVGEEPQGPEIEIVAPLLTTKVTNPLSIHVEFKSRRESTKVNMKSLKLTYKKLWGIDITDRIIDYVEGESIKAPDVELPEGEHTLEIYIEDNDENVSTKLITVSVAER